MHGLLQTSRSGDVKSGVTVRGRVLLALGMVQVCRPLNVGVVVLTVSDITECAFL